MSEKKKEKAPLTPVEKLQELAMLKKVGQEMERHLQIHDKTLAEFFVSHAEKKARKLLHDSPVSSVSSSNILEASKTLQTDLVQQGADNISLSFCTRLVELVLAESPRIARARNKRAAAAAKAINTNNDPQRPVVLSSMLESDRKHEMQASFPGLAKTNLNSAVPVVDDFYEHDVTAKTTGKRNLSNLPAWMTTTKTSSEQPAAKRSKQTMQLYDIYQGTIRKILDFGMIIDLSLHNNDGQVAKEAIVYNNQITNNKNVSHAFKRNQRVWCKVISIMEAAAGDKILVSLKDVDQTNGADLMPHRSMAAVASEGLDLKSSTFSSVIHPGLDVQAFKAKEAQEDARRLQLLRSAGESAENKTVRRRKQLTEQELFEAQQLIRSGVLPVEQYPTYDAEGGLGMLAVEETEEETEVELAEVEPAFLHGQTRRSGRDLEPIKIVKNPDGSMQRAAMQQGSLAKERRELRQAQANNLIDSIPKDLNRPWEDPLPESGERHFAQELRSINMAAFDGEPVWKKKAENKTLSYGIISNKSIKEQRESLPVYRLKKELMEAIANNQILVVVGETGALRV
jgi:ATP-dependent RNA helicase DHX8/PRP22